MIRNRPPTIVPGVKAPRLSASEVCSRPTDDGGRRGFGTGAGPDSVGRRDSGPSSWPQDGQKRPESGTSDPHRGHRSTMLIGYLSCGGLPKRPGASAGSSDCFRLPRPPVLQDALVADVTPASDLGRAYGFHRAMDHAGAMTGPLIAAALLWWGWSMRSVFAWAAVPAALSVAALLLGVREKARDTVGVEPVSVGVSAPLGSGFRLYLLVLAVFTLGNSSDAFLLLRAQDAGVPLAAIPLLWAFHHAVKSAFSTWEAACPTGWGGGPPSWPAGASTPWRTPASPSSSDPSRCFCSSPSTAFSTP